MVIPRPHLSCSGNHGPSSAISTIGALFHVAHSTIASCMCTLQAYTVLVSVCPNSAHSPGMTHIYGDACKPHMGKAETRAHRSHDSQHLAHLLSLLKTTEVLVWPRAWALVPALTPGDTQGNVGQHGSWHRQQPPVICSCCREPAPSQSDVGSSLRPTVHVQVWQSHPICQDNTTLSMGISGQDL